MRYKTQLRCLAVRAAVNCLSPWWRLPDGIGISSAAWLLTGTNRFSYSGAASTAEAALAKSKAGRSYVLERRLIRTGLFDTDWYKSQYPEEAESGLSAARHYLEEGYCRGYRPNPLFDTRWYLERYEDVRRSGMNPLLHYAMHGYREGRDPRPDFQTNFYLLTYPDVRASKMNPLAHYLLYGGPKNECP